MVSGLGMERYGLWLAVSSIVDISSGLGFGLGLSLVRKVAASSKSSSTIEVERFVSSGRILYLLLGIAVMTGLILLAGVFSAGLHLSSSSRSLVLPVFALVGFAFVGEQLRRVFSFDSRWVATLRSYRNGCDHWNDNECTASFGCSFERATRSLL